MKVGDDIDPEDEHSKDFEELMKVKALIAALTDHGLGRLAVKIRRNKLTAGIIKDLTMKQWKLKVCFAIRL